MHQIIETLTDVIRKRRNIFLRAHPEIERDETNAKKNSKHNFKVRGKLNTSG